VHRADRAAPERSAAAAPVEKVAPWQQWKRLPMSASPGGAYPVTFTVSDPELDREQNARYSKLVTSAAHKHFKIEKPPHEDQGPAAYLVGAGKRKRLRVAYDELIVRFEPRVPPARCNAIIAETGFREVERSRLVEDRWIVRHVHGIAGESLLAAADAFARFEEVRFAWPNSVAEYHRASGGVAPLERRWWLDKIKVNWSSGTRRLAKGDSDIVIAVLDDGVDIDHPNLQSRVATDPGRDYVFDPDHPEHKNPRPKVKVADEADSDFHGTECAGVICSDGKKKKFLGVAPGCTLVAVRVFDGPELINEPKLAAAFEYATGVADVISCSWDGEDHEDVVEAINDTILGRGGKGTVLVCSAGNDQTDVYFPARHSRAVAVGACGPNDEVTDYSNFGDDLDLVAPSSFAGTDVYSTDVSLEGWGHNTGVEDDAAGLFWDEFGRTSAAAPVAAGVAALCLSVNPNLTAAELRTVLQETADKVGGVTYNQGHSQEFGYGCINAAKAVARAKALLTGVPLP
jgi:subtilisin family serine protease